MKMSNPNMIEDFGAGIDSGGKDVCKGAEDEMQEEYDGKVLDFDFYNGMPLVD